MPIELLFGRGLYSEQPLELVFGDDGGELEIPPEQVEIYAYVTPPVFSAVAVYDNRVQRYKGLTADLPFELAGYGGTTLDAFSVRGELLSPTVEVPWGGGEGVSSDTSSETLYPQRVEATSSAVFGAIKSSLSHGAAPLFEVGGRLTVEGPAAHSIARPVGRVALSPTEVAAILSGKSPSLVYRASVAVLGKAHSLLQGVGAPRSSVTGWVPWGEAQYPPPGKDPYLTVPEEVTPPFVGSSELLFQCPALVLPAPVILVFGGYCEVAPVLPVLQSTVYVIMNSMYLKRVSDDVEIEVYSANLNADPNGWGWQFSLSISADDQDKIEPTVGGVVEVELDLNGVKWRFIVETYTVTESFGKRALSIEGRSLTAYLDDPYASTHNWSQPSGSPYSAVQLAQLELDRVDSAPGFTLDWDLVGPSGWLVPGGSWSYNNLSPMQAIKAVAEGVKGFVYSDPLSKIIRVRSRYPYLPWEWAATPAEVTIPVNLVKSRSLEWLEAPAYNGVFVSGESTGVAGFIKRTGTAGEILAPSHVSALIGEGPAALEAGRAILSGAGRQSKRRVDVPLHPGVGLVLPRSLVEVVDTEAPSWKGLSGGVNISATWGRGLIITQSFELEQHY